MRINALMVSVSMLVVVVPTGAQQFGTVELGAFGGSNSFSNEVRWGDVGGGGMRLGFYLSPRVSVELDGNGLESDRPLRSRGVHRMHKSETVSLVSLTGRLTWTPIVAGPLSVLVGAGVAHTQYANEQMYGVSALVGARLWLTPYAAARVDIVADELPNMGRTNLGLHFGFSFFRMTRGTIMNTTTVADAPRRGPTMVPVNFVANAGGMTAASDSLRAKIAPGAGELDFAAGTSELTDRSQKLLDTLIDVLLREPLAHTVIVGPAGTSGEDGALCDRRAAVAKAYLTHRGIAEYRITVAARGAMQMGGDASPASKQAEQIQLLIVTDDARAQSSGGLGKAPRAITRIAQGD